MSQSIEQVEPEQQGSLSLRLEELCAASIMAILAVLTILNVLTRYFSNISFAFTEELSVFLVVLMTFVGTATAFARSQNLAMTALADRLPPAAKKVQQSAVLLCGIALFAVLAWYGGVAWLDDLESGLVSPGLGVPQWWYTLILPLCSVLIIVRQVQVLVLLWRVAR